MNQAQLEGAITQDKELCRNLEVIIQDIKGGEAPIRTSRERSIAITKLQEAVMWLGMDLNKAISEESGGEETD